ncbi:MAG: hypothetical protein R3F34_09580 [Planctomycetota bacterium]
MAGASGFSIVPALPPGLVVDGGSGLIHGTPTAPSPFTTYTVTATGPGGAGATATVSFDVVETFDASRFAYSSNLLPGAIGHWRVDAASGEFYSAGGAAANAPVRMAAHPLGDRLFVLEFEQGLLRTFAIDPFDGGLTLVDTDVVGKYPLALAVAPDGRNVYVGSSDTLRTYRVDEVTGLLLPVQVRPIPEISAIAVPSDGTTILVASSKFSAFGVLERDPVDGSVLGLLGTNVLNAPFALASTPDSRRILAASLAGHSVHVYDADPPSPFLVELASVAVPEGPFDLEVRDDALWVASFTARALSRFSLDADSLPVVPGEFVSLPGSPPSVSPTAGGGYVVPLFDLGVALRADSPSGTMDVQALRTFVTDLVLAPAPTGRTRTTPFVVALDGGAGALEVLSTSDGTQIGPAVAAGQAPSVIASGPHGARLAVLDGETGGLRRFEIDQSTFAPKLTGPIVPTGFGARDLLFDGDGERLWAAVGSQLLTLRVDPKGKPVLVDQTAVGPAPAAIASDSAARFVAVTDRSDDLLRIFLVGPNGDEPVPAAGFPFDLRDIGDPPLGAGALAFEPGGRFLVVALESIGELRTYAIQSVIGSATFAGKIGGLGTPVEIASARSGDRIVVADSSGPALHLVVLDPKGVPILADTQPLSAEPAGLVLDASTDDALVLLSDGTFERYSISGDAFASVTGTSTGVNAPRGLVLLPVWADF